MKKNLEKDAELEKVKIQVEEFLTNTIAARQASERDRDYKDHKQWTDHEIEKLRARGQAPIVVNRVKPKVDGLLGLISLRETSPKAYPRTDKHEKSSEVVTDALRFVTENNDFKHCKMEVAENFFVEGYGGAIVDVKQNGSGEVEIHIEQIPWDRIYFDPHSRKKDFSDARYMGMILWIDAEEVEEKFSNVESEDLEAIMSGKGNLDTTFEDRPRWIDTKKKRVRIAHHFYIEDGVWNMCIFTDGLFLVDPAPSPYLDEFGQPSNAIELVSAYIDRDNNRYGEVRGFIDQQDEINHRRSKALHLLSQRQTAARQGAVKDVAAMKRELAKPDGHVEYIGDKGDFEILNTSDMAQGQFELYQDAKAELDAISVNAQLSGERQNGSLSGVAINKLQQAGTIELNGLFTALNGWEKRIYRKIWARVKQFWNEEKWIRITDDQDTLQWVGLNAKVTVQQFLEEKINDKSENILTRKQASAAYMALMQNEDPILEKVIDIKNKVSEIDVDIIIDQSFDVINVQQEQFDLISKLYNPNDPNGIDIIDLIQLSQIRGKDNVIDRIKKGREAQAQGAQGQQQLQIEHAQAKTAEVQTKAAVNQQTAMQKQIENQIMVTQPPDMRPQVTV